MKEILAGLVVVLLIAGCSGTSVTRDAKNNKPSLADLLEEEWSTIVFPDYSYDIQPFDEKADLSDHRDYAEEAIDIVYDSLTDVKDLGDDNFKEIHKPDDLSHQDQDTLQDIDIFEKAETLEEAQDIESVDVQDLGVEETTDQQEEDTSCQPDCTGKECGSDGCLGVCGYCAYGYICDPTGKCVSSICPKQCSIIVNGQEIPKECGPDGCGGFCGFCDEGESCGDDGLCYDISCQGSCEGKVCGDDGCGHSCGNCEAGKICNEQGQCIPNPCGDVDYKGKCVDKFTQVECQNYQLVYKDCHQAPGTICGWNQFVGKYDCIPETGCEPQCTFDDLTPKECGDDGCWGVCGVCPKGWACSNSKCYPATGGECAWIDSEVGLCIGHVWWFCANNQLNSYNCMEKEGKTCAWSAGANAGKGGYTCK